MRQDKARKAAATVDLNSVESRQALAKMVLRLFQHWKLGTADQLNLLGYCEPSDLLLAGLPTPGLEP